MISYKSLKVSVEVQSEVIHGMFPAANLLIILVLAPILLIFFIMAGTGFSKSFRRDFSIVQNDILLQLSFRTIEKSLLKYILSLHQAIKKGAIFQVPLLI